MLRNCSFSVMLTVALGLVLAGTTASQAGPIYVQAGVSGRGSGLYSGVADSFENYWSQGASSASAAGADGSVGASSSISLLTNPGIRLFARAGSDTEWTPEGGIYSSESFAAAQWVDVIRVGGLTTPPESIRVTVGVDGVHNYQVDGSGSDARVRAGVANISGQQGVSLSPVPPNYVGQFTGGNVETSEIIGTEGGLLVDSKTRNLTIIGGTNSYTYSWLVDFELPYSEIHGGYLLNLYSAVGASGFRGSDSVADFGHTIRLIGVSQTDGSALTGPVTFESGYTLQAVPEPSSLTLLGVVALGLHWNGLRQRRATDA